MNQDWSAVSDAIKDRLDERGMTMTDLASKSGVSLTTVRELVHVLNTRRRQPRTLVALSQALGWPADHLGAVLRGRPADADRSDDRADVREELRDLRRRVEALERAAGTTS
ncbi:MAG: helix-turn-helix domain-containing protein [Actinomycetota bacterium]|uniref:helix-turn-helix domain-containing protein n=1 Tax=Pseudonocardia alni TaxID=33907 RepID=UPI0033C243E5